MIILVSVVTSCDVQSGITKKSVEKYAQTPASTRAPTPEETPIDPADIVQVDTSVQGALISVDESKKKKTVVCKKYDRVMVNNNDNAITINGACRQIMVNGDQNEIVADAVAEIVFNGVGNEVRYSRFVNGNRPLVIDNKGGNQVEKTTSAGKD